MRPQALLMSERDKPCTRGPESRHWLSIDRGGQSSSLLCTNSHPIIFAPLLHWHALLCSVSVCLQVWDAVGWSGLDFPPPPPRVGWQWSYPPDAESLEDSFAKICILSFLFTLFYPFFSRNAYVSWIQFEILPPVFPFSV